MKQVLVTTGATYPFDSLVEAAFSDPVLDAFQELKVDSLRIQYGSTRKSEELFNDLCISRSLQLEQHCIKVSGFGLTQKMIDEVKTSWMVVSHAGTGTILDTLRLENAPRLVVVPNDKLMGGHQSEVASAMHEMGCLICIDEKSEEAFEVKLAKAIHLAGMSEYIKPLPARGSIADIVEEEANGGKRKHN
ncbi:hypothetical protein V1511DRAFT_455293 [Dipodascopsis uninucleata]